MPPPARSFADELRARNDDDIADLLLARPDLARPVPADLTALSARAGSRASVLRALERLDASQLRTLEAVMVGPAADLLGCTEADLQPHLDLLWRLALLWRSPEGPRPVRVVGELLREPAGLGPAARSIENYRLPTDPGQSLDGLSDAARAAMDRLRWGPTRAGFDGQSALEVLTELVAAGLMVRIDETTGEVPREIGLWLRQGRLYADGLAAAPAPDQPTDTGRVVAGAAVAVREILWRMERLAAHWQLDPPRVLRAGGLGSRDLKLTGDALDTDPGYTAFLVELAATADLIGSDDASEPVWLPTRAYDDWLRLDVPHRWARLAVAWRDSGRAPFLVGTPGDKGKINALGSEAHWPLMRSRRHDVLAILAGTVDGYSSTAMESALHWLRPLRLPAGAPTRAAEVLQEIEWLGAGAGHALSPWGRPLADTGAGPEVVAAALIDHLPRPDDVLLVQADHTVIAPGALSDQMRRFTDTVLDVESSGGATVFRITANSLRRGFDQGFNAAEILSTLQTASPAPLPQPVEYLVQDAARQHGQTRVGGTTAYIRSDDEAALHGVLADSRTGVLRLRRIAPTVLVSPVSADTVLDVLREIGHAPVAETADGVSIVGVRRPPRADERRGSDTPVTVQRLTPALAREAVQRMRTTVVEATGPRVAATDPAVTLAALRDAAAGRMSLWVGYSDTLGEVRRALLQPDRVEGGRVTGEVDGQRRTLALHRIIGVAPA